MKVERVRRVDLIEGDEFINSDAWECETLATRSMFVIRTGSGQISNPRDMVYRIVTPEADDA